MEYLAAFVSAANIENWRGGGVVCERSEGCGNTSPKAHPPGRCCGAGSPGLAAGVEAERSRSPVYAPTLGYQRPANLLPRAPVRQRGRLIPRRESHRGDSGALLDDTERPAFAQDTRHGTAEVTDQVGLVNDQQRTHREVAH